MTAPIELVLPKLAKVRRVDGKPNDFRASCPCDRHERGDQNPSLSISIGNDGAVLLKCFAGCTAKEIVEAIGLTLADLFVRQQTNGHGHDNMTHDPDVCGIDRASSCSACQTAWDRADAGPSLPIDAQLWARMVRGLPWLERMTRAGQHDRPDMPAADDAAVAIALAALCRADVRERVLIALAPGIRAIVRDELSRVGGAG